MADTNSSAKAQEPSRHAYDDPTLSPKQFLYAVMHARNLPLVTRMDAANRLMRLVYSGDYVPGEWCSREPSLTIKIGGIPQSAPGPANESNQPRTPDSCERKIGNQQSFSSDRSNNHGPLPEDPDPCKFETNTDPLTYDDIQQVKAKVLELYPDIDPHTIPEHLTLCECGHWLLYPCKCASIH